jgi:hypothetical protein
MSLEPSIRAAVAIGEGGNASQANGGQYRVVMDSGRIQSTAPVLDLAVSDHLPIALNPTKNPRDNAKRR